MDNFNEFQNVYHVSKTLRFELKPQGATLSHIESDGILNEDSEREERYQKAKVIIDAYHRDFIDTSLCNASFDWHALADALEQYLGEKDDTELKKVQSHLRKGIYDTFSKRAEFKGLFKGDLIKKILPQWLESRDSSGEKREIIGSFDKFTTYFTGFQDNRKNVYSKDEISTAVTYRLVHENFPRFRDNIFVYRKIKEIAPEIIETAENNLNGLLGEKKLDEVFTVDYYNSVLTQSGIDFYNSLIGGGVVQGLNECSNLYFQHHPEIRVPKNSVQMSVLYKQILSDHDPLFSVEKFENDSELYQTVTAFLSENNGEKDADFAQLLVDIADIFSRFSDFDTESIWIAELELSRVSHEMYGQWDYFRNAIRHLLETEVDASGKKRKKKDIEKAEKAKAFSVEMLRKSVLEDISPGDMPDFDGKLSAYVKIDNMVDSIHAAQSKFIALAGETLSFKSNKEHASVLKEYLDAWMNLIHFMKAFAVPEEFRQGSAFYVQFSPCYERLLPVIHLYDMARNYVTQKPYEEQKYKLNFKNPTFCNGWDLSKEQDNTAVLFMKDGMYYLGVLNANRKPNFNNIEECSKTEAHFDKIEYKLLPGPNKMLPKVFFSKKGIETYHPPKNIVQGYRGGMHKKGDSFDIAFMRDLIDYFKMMIPQYPGWDRFGFHFSATETYEDISGFYREVEHQGYHIRFKRISADVMNELVENNQLYLFQIYNKDFSPQSTGRPNLHTLYWKALFEPRNLEDVIYKLNGEAELFYRRKSIKKPTIHQPGEIKVNRWAKNGASIPEDVYRELFLYLNHRHNGELSREARNLLDEELVSYSDVTHEIIKDRRYAVDKFLFHVPITMNFKSGTDINFNQRVNRYIKEHPDMNILGIDRGERNLIYVTLIDRAGHLLLQKSYNLITQDTYVGKHSVDYHAKLDQREKERDKARKNWTSIGKIKDLKEGYLSQVVHEITGLMVQYHAVIVMEELNYGFKRGRFRVEKQVYQKFEKMLIDKLNYFVDKGAGPDSIGGVYHGLQLTKTVDSYKDIGRQCGFIFYIPAAYTSKIDPVTGFVNLFDMRTCTTSEGRREFLLKFHSMSYDCDRDMFLFDFDYNRFPTYQKSYRTAWTLTSAGTRIVHYKEKEQHCYQTISPTEEIKSLLQRFSVPWQNGENLVSMLSDMAPDKSNGALFDGLFYAVKSILQMRNSNASTGDDYIISPALNRQGEYFDSRNGCADLPQDADANGAYHIACKGQMVLERICSKSDETGKIDYKEMKISVEDWLRSRQE